MIRKMAKESILILMELIILVILKMVSEMEREPFIITQQIILKETGSMENWVGKDI